MQVHRRVRVYVPHQVLHRREAEQLLAPAFADPAVGGTVEGSFGVFEGARLKVLGDPGDHMGQAAVVVGARGLVPFQGEEAEGVSGEFVAHQVDPQDLVVLPEALVHLRQLLPPEPIVRQVQVHQSLIRLEHLFEGLADVLDGVLLLLQLPLQERIPTDQDLILGVHRTSTLRRHLGDVVVVLLEGGADGVVGEVQDLHLGVAVVPQHLRQRRRPSERDLVPPQKQHRDTRVVLQHLCEALSPRASNLVVAEVEEGELARGGALVEGLVDHFAEAVPEAVALQPQHPHLGLAPAKDLAHLLVRDDGEEWVKAHVDLFDLALDCPQDGHSPSVGEPVVAHVHRRYRLIGVLDAF
mmetsp:Transcript_20380/g.19357  ORF Transcript_20380/g.19357 Transcript_20380/m.19357 type:complete len:353 (+) Transcript_20380:1183-2241(+)